MFAVLAIVAWCLGVGLTAKRFGPLQEAMIVSGIAAIIAVQYFVFGPS